MRLFFAAWPPDIVARTLADWAREAQRVCRGTVTREPMIHLTLAFLGDADPDRARGRGHAIRRPGVFMRIEQARYWAHNRIVWVGPERTPEPLQALARDLGEKRTFAAHVTLMRQARPTGPLPPLPALEWPVAEFLLVSSALGLRGPAYEVLERFALE